MRPEEEIARLANTILSDPDKHLGSFVDFFAYESRGDQQNAQIRSLTLLSATAVIIDIYPSVVIPEGTQEDTDSKTIVSVEQKQKLKRSNQIGEHFDKLLREVKKINLAASPCAILNSSICSVNCIGQQRLNHLVSLLVAMACSGGTSQRLALTGLSTRLQNDLSNNNENLDVVKAIVQTICREKHSHRLNVLIPVLGRMKIRPVRMPSERTPSGNIDKQLVRDLALGQAGRGDQDIVSTRKNQAVILADLMAMFIRVIRTVSDNAEKEGGQLTYSTSSLLVCIDGIANQINNVNGDLASELETELLDLAKQYLLASSNHQITSESTILGITALTALLNISKGSKERQTMLTDKVIAAAETLVPVALSHLLGSGSSLASFNASETLTSLCKGALGVASLWGSDKCLLSMAVALTNSLTLGFDDQSKLIVDLLINIIARGSALVRSAIDPDGVLVDGDISKLEKREVHLFPQLKFLLKHRAVDSDSLNVLFGHLSKICPQLAVKQGQDAVTSQQAHKDEVRIAKIRKVISKPHKSSVSK